jgi:hypothetical protein
MSLPIYDNIPELSPEANAIARRRKIAEAMLAQSQEQQPTNQMAGQVVAPVSWTQGLAKLAQAYVGRKQAEDADKAEQGLANKRQQMVADTLAKLQQTAQGSAGVEGIEAQPERTIQAPAPMQPNQTAPNYNTVPEVVPAVAGRAAVPAVAPNKRQAIMDAMMSNLPEVQKYGGAMLGFDEMDATAKDKKDAREENAQNALLLAREKMADSRATALEKQQAQQEFLMIMQKNNFGQQESMARLAAALKPAPAEKAPIQITDEAGNVKLVDYQGNLIKDLGKVGKPTAGYQKAEIAKKKATNDIDLTITELENASKDGGLIDQSTGSGAGALVDMAGDFVGKSTKGSIAVGRMRPIYDMALKMVPRFEGPQSDKDTASYKEAAGNLANPNVPNKTKKAAAKEIVRLMKARKNQFIDKANEGTELDTGLIGAPNGGAPKAPSTADEYLKSL